MFLFVATALQLLGHVKASQKRGSSVISRNILQLLIAHILGSGNLTNEKDHSRLPRCISCRR